MIPNIEPHVFSTAVRDFWKIRGVQAEKGIADQGSRPAVTGGQQMNSFAVKIRDLMIAAGASASDIYAVKNKELPGFFRPAKEWDIVVVSKGRLLAAVELKSQVGPSFGNNFNNRTEEAIGSAVDIWTAYRERAFKQSPQPWLGYLFLLEECSKSTTPVKISEPHFLVFPEFKKASYARRYELLCRKLVLERHYNSACFMLADKQRAEQTENYSEPSEDLSAYQFLGQLLSHIRTLV
jgi:hypothetical protein